MIVINLSTYPHCGSKSTSHTVYLLVHAIEVNLSNTLIEVIYLPTHTTEVNLPP